MLHGTSGAASDQDAQLFVFTKQAASYSLADLAGVWQGAGLASGPGAPWWERDSLTIDPDGTFTVFWTGSDGSSGAGTGSLSISSTGVITCVSGDCADRTTMSFMDAGKTVAAGTRTWPDGETREIKIFTKDPVAGVPEGVTAAASAPSKETKPAPTPAGSLKVTINPTAAVKAGAKWNVDGGPYQNSGATVGKLTVGAHIVSFKAITGWTPPANQNVNISNGQTTSTSGLYVQQTGSLTVTINPAAAVSAGAQWKVDSGTLQNSGATVGNIAVGSHKVTFNTIAGWTAPAAQTVTITNGNTTSANGTYLEKAPNPGHYSGSCTISFSAYQCIVDGVPEIVPPSSGTVNFAFPVPKGISISSLESQLCQFVIGSEKTNGCLNPTCSVTTTSNSYTVSISCTATDVQAGCDFPTLSESCSATLQ